MAKNKLISLPQYGSLFRIYKCLLPLSLSFLLSLFLHTFYMCFFFHAYISALTGRPMGAYPIYQRVKL